MESEDREEEYAEELTETEPGTCKRHWKESGLRDNMQNTVLKPWKGSTGEARERVRERDTYPGCVEIEHQTRLPILKEVDVKPRYSRTSIAPAPQEEDAREKPRRQSVEHPRRVSHDLRRVSVDGSTNAPAPVAKTVSRDNSERQLGAHMSLRVFGARCAFRLVCSVCSFGFRLSCCVVAW